jgi:4-diphosphocytidyl-2-C-methyl-D-erythritol kinase
MEARSARLRARAPGKVNLCLFVGDVRADGRHQLVTLFESVSLADEVEVVTGDTLEDQVVCRPVLPGPNIVSRALAGLRARGWDAPPVKVVIDKRIPIAGGMGGGSADAAATLRIAARLAPVSPNAIGELAGELGADVPSQLRPGLVIGTGAGERIEPVRALAPHAFVLVPASAQLSTAAVYAEADRLGRIRDAAELAKLYDLLEHALAGGRQLPANLLVNDLEPAARSLCPAIAQSIDAALQTGADHAFVCGSGPTVAGLHWGADGVRRAAAAADALRREFPGASVAAPVAAEL